MDKKQLQFEWDRLLVESFYVRSNYSMSLVVKMFNEAYETSDEEVFALLRTPRMGFQLKIGVSRFICAYLPKIGEALWKYNKDRAFEVAKVVNSLKSDTRINAVDEEKVRKEHTEVGYAKRKYRQARTERVKDNELWNAHRRSNQWGVSK
jgi:hypothetical protein